MTTTTRPLRHGPTARIELTWPVDLAASLDEGQAFGWSAPESDDGWWIGVVSGQPLRVRHVEADSKSPGALEVAARPPDGDAEQAASMVSRYLRLDDDLAGISEALSADAVLAPIERRWRGLRLLRQEPWECLVSFVISAQCHLPRIKRNMQNLAEACGAADEAWGQTVYRVPEPDVVAQLGEARLRQIGLGFRAPFLASAAAMVVEGALSLAALRAMPRESARETLLTLKGVGPKIADCILAFSLDHTEAFAVDRWVSRAVSRLYLNDERLPEDRIAAWGRNRFGPRAAYAQQLLFQEERENAMRERGLPGSVIIRERRLRRARATHE